MADFDVVIKDYQAIESAHIAVSKGLNIIIGDTNNGKSAILRAIEDALFNSGVDSRVRAGQRYSAVKIGNGKDTLMWRRDSHGKNNKTMYQITGVNEDKPIEKVGRTQLEEVASKFNITEVRMSNNNREKINFWRQGDAPFLTDKTPNQLFEFLSLSSCDEYIKILKEMKSDVRELNSNIISLGSTIDTLNAINDEKKTFIDKNEGFDELYKKIVVTNQEVEKFNKIEDIVNKIKNLEARLELKRITLDKVNQEINRIDFDSVKKSMKEVIELERSNMGLFKLLGSIKSKQEVLKTSKGVLLGIDSKLDKIGDIGSFKERIIELNEVQQKINTIVPIMRSLGSKRDYLKSLKDKYSEISLRAGEVDLESFRDEIRRYDELQVTVNNLQKMLLVIENKRTSKDKLEDSLELLEDDYNKAVKEFEDFKDEIGVCPLCGGDLH